MDNLASNMSNVIYDKKPDNKGQINILVQLVKLRDERQLNDAKLKKYDFDGALLQLLYDGDAIGINYLSKWKTLEFKHLIKFVKSINNPNRFNLKENYMISENILELIGKFIDDASEDFTMTAVLHDFIVQIIKLNNIQILGVILSKINLNIYVMEDRNKIIKAAELNDQMNQIIKAELEPIIKKSND